MAHTLEKCPQLQQSQEADVPVRSLWLLHPVLDYIFACGGIVWLLFVVHYFVLAGTDKGATAAFLFSLSAIGALFLCEGHTAATLVRTYGNRERRDRFWPYTCVLPIILIVAAAFGTVVQSVTPILVKIYLLLVPHHMMSQSYGITKLYCLKHSYHLDRTEERALLMVAQCTTLFAVARQLTYQQWSGTTFLSQPIPFWGPLPEPILVIPKVLLVAALTLFGASIIFRAHRTQQSFPLPGLLTMGTSVAAFTMGQTATGIYWLYVSAFFHATQYLMVVLSSHLHENGNGGLPPADRLRTLIRNSHATRFLGMCLLVSVFIYIGIPRILELFGLGFASAAAAIFATVNIHHFLLDGVLWRLRHTPTRHAVAS